MLNTLNKLYRKLIYILLHVFALYAILVLHHRYLLCCVRTRHFAILVLLILHHQNLSYWRTICFLEGSSVHCWVWTDFILMEARTSTYHWLISWRLQGWYLLLYWFRYLQSINQTLCKSELGTAVMLDMYCLWTVEAGGLWKYELLEEGLAITFQDSWFRIFIP
jgi:hypothetical protein